MFPALYHAHHKRHLDDLPFWLKLADKHGDLILELGCGTGRVLLPLAQAGYRMYGLDSNHGMLALLRQGLTPELIPKVSVWQGDMVHFRIALNFPLIIMPCNTFSILSYRQRRSSIAHVASHLLDQGLFAASLPNPTLLKYLPEQSDPVIEETYPHPLDGEPVQVSSGWVRTEDHFTVTWHYDHLLPDGSVERFSYHVRHNLVPPKQINDELGDAGLRIRERFGDFDGSSYSVDAPFFIFLAAGK